MWRQWSVRASQTLVVLSAATVATGETSERYDAARHVDYVTHNLRRRLRPNVQGESSEWLQSQPPTFPYLLARSSGDNPASIVPVALGTTDTIGSMAESTASTIDALFVPASELDALVRLLAIKWKALKASLHADVPTAFDPTHSTEQQRTLRAIRAALEAIKHDTIEIETPDLQDEAADDDDEEGKSGDERVPPAKLVFFLRDFDVWSDEDATQWFEWVHQVTSNELAHVVLSTAKAVTPIAISEWQRLFKVPDADFVAILLRLATGSADQSSAQEKLRVLSQRHSLNLRGLDEDAAGDEDEVSEAKPVTESQIIIDAVGNWWGDLECICSTLNERGVSVMESDEERLTLVHDVCTEYEAECMAQLLQSMQFHDESVELKQPASTEQREATLSGLQTWKCLEVVAAIGDKGVSMGAAQDLMKKDDKPINCAHPIEALLPYDQRTHGEQTFMQLIDAGLFGLRPKNDVEIGVIPSDAKALVAPCWVETRPVVKSAFEKIWRNDDHYNRLRELERFEDNHKLREEVALYEHEIQERRNVLQEKERELQVLESTLTKAEKAQRKAELSLLELEIRSNEVYLERLHALLD
ncbi:hypothetical protein Poli38472_002863 [Pythium oligandrum]|uniref:Uncharacterized protein n=1 Tax=Pythium oligandrum TaxID=41045 RepID=A0A8K1FFL7_PYTOL|nr:hypothetical protein Poli38472_002863 [Pythium oligandrum]|eukprot:TMW56938.1 hypothetical protein Poli38472_002863 [Pythium oligandrum]